MIELINDEVINKVDFDGEFVKRDKFLYNVAEEFQ